MNEAAVRKRISELCDVVTESRLCGHNKKKAPDGIYYSVPLAEGASIEDSVDLLRLQIKYVMFDLEATRRENRYLRQMLENRHRRGSENLGGSDGDM